MDYFAEVTHSHGQESYLVETELPCYDWALAIAKLHLPEITRNKQQSNKYIFDYEVEGEADTVTIEYLRYTPYQLNP